jgi:polar amino acid transport system substrate-binding protein
MLKKLSLTLLSIFLMVPSIKPAIAETVMEKVARTGVLTLGTRFDLVPYSYVNEKEELDGYSLNIVNLIREDLQEYLGKEITLQVVETNDVIEGIPKLVSGEIDLTCATVFTWERDKFVDFSLSYSISGIRLLVPKGSSLGSESSLAGKRVGVIPKTIADDTIKLVQPQAILVPFDSPEAGFKALQAGEIDALAGDSLILDGHRQKTDPEAYELVPDVPYARYGIACMVPENNSTFLNLANQTIVKFMQGYLIGEPGPVDMLNRWIGPQGITNVVNPDAVREFFEYTIMTREQVPFAQEK